MKKLITISLLALLSPSAQASSEWYYVLDNEKEGLTIGISQSDESRVTLIPTKDHKAGYGARIGLPTDLLIASCGSKCVISVTPRGKPMQKFTFKQDSANNEYKLLSKHDSFLKLFVDNSVIKLKVPTDEDSETITFTQPDRLDLKQLQQTNP